MRWCSIECNTRDFCSSWWLRNDRCYMSNFLVSAGGKTGSQPIYSNRQWGNKIPSTIKFYFPQVLQGDPNHLLRGLKTFNIQQSCITIKPKSGYPLLNGHAFLGFEFGSFISIRKIVIGMPNTEFGSSTQMPDSETVVSVGNSTNSMEEVGNLANANIDDERTFVLNPPKRVKYLVIRQKDLQDLGICFIEVF